MANATNSAGVARYKDMMYRVATLIYPNLNNDEIKAALDYSIVLKMLIVV